MKLEKTFPSQMTGIWAVINHNSLRGTASAFNWCLSGRYSSCPKETATFSKKYKVSHRD